MDMKKVDSSRRNGESPKKNGDASQENGNGESLKTTDCPQFDQQLIERFARGSGTVFVGAGISMRSGLPSWAQLMEPLRKYFGERISPSATHLDVAELYEAENGRFGLVHHLKRELGDVRYRLSRTHELIVSLPVQRIYTTNFDDLLEKAAHRKWINRSVIYDASHIAYSDTGPLSIVKLHGDLGAPDSLVISANDYYAYFARNPAVASLLTHELQNHTVLFLGYSFSDPDFGMILGEVAEQLGSNRPTLYALQLSPSPLAARGLEKRGIKVIALDAEPGTRKANKEIEHWLDCFLQNLRRYERRKRQHADTMSPRYDTFGIPKYKHSLIRLRTLRRIEEILRADAPVIVVKGEAGIGKTQLVATAAADMLVPGGAVVVNDVFKSTIWIRPTGPGSSHTLDHILRTIVNSLESFPTTGSNTEDMADDANRVLEEHRVIVVIEDLEDCDSKDSKISDIKDWLEHLGSEAHPRSRIVVTSRKLDLLGFMVEVGRLKPDDAKKMVVEHADSIMLRRKIPDGLDEKTVRRLAEDTLGNPQAIQLALGLVLGTGDVAAMEKVFTELNGPNSKSNENIESLFSALIAASLDEMKKCRPDAQRILRAMLVFPDSEPAPEKLLRIACGMDYDSGAFSAAADCCVQFGLLERDTRKDTFSLHRTSKIILESEFRNLGPDESFKRLTGYLLAYLHDDRNHNVVCRDEIGEEYWNALVRDQMSKIDRYWPVIKHVMTKTGTTSRVVDFVLLLVHYMDSRFLNAERAEFIKAAMKALESMPLVAKIFADKTLALLKIDALAWTYMENSAFDKAAKEINEGLHLIDKGEHPDLVALAEAWRARMASERNRYEEAYRHLIFAAQAARRANKPWIRMRVKMILGDVRHRDSKAQTTEEAHEAREADRKETKARKALAAYRTAEHLAERYGGEGDGYQTSPRIAFALLEQTDNQEAREEAAQRFRKLVENSQVAAGRLYGQYGNAIIAAKNNATHEAIAQLEAIHREIFHLGKGNVLLSLAENLYRQTVHQRS
ncbi:MAG: SIR2 family protein [Pseudomonadota bacterium]